MTDPSPIAERPMTLNDAQAMPKHEGLSAGLMAQLERMEPSAAARLVPSVLGIKAKVLAIPKPSLARILADHPEWVEHPDENDNTPLLSATSFGNIDAIEVLLAAGANTRARNNHNHDALSIAASFDGDAGQQKALAHALLENGVFTQAQKDHALRGAAARSNAGMVNALLAHDAGFGTPPSPLGPLSIVCMDRYPSEQTIEVVRALLKTPGVAEVINAGWDGIGSCRSPVQNAARTGKHEVLAELIAAGASVNPPRGLKNVTPETPLMHAAARVDKRAIEMLVRAGADGAVLNDQRENALHWLVKGAIAIDPPPPLDTIVVCAQMLIDAGADPDQAGYFGSKPRDLASRNGPAALVEALGALSSSRSMDAQTPGPGADGPARAPSPRL